MKDDRIRITRGTFESILQAYASKTQQRWSSTEVVRLHTWPRGEDTRRVLTSSQGARAVLSWMSLLGVSRDSFVWASLVDAYTHSRHKCQIESFKGIEKVSKRCCISQKTHNWKEMEAANAVRSSIVLRALIRGYLAVGDLQTWGFGVGLCSLLTKSRVETRLIPEAVSAGYTLDAAYYAPLIEYGA